VDIIANILSEAAEGAKKTHIMYKSNLSFRQLQAYLDFLLDRGLLMRSESGGGGNPNLFQTTAKGRAFLQAYRDLKALLAT
jgi:predicted transcriptional regulator